jgi:hypothetical protein
MLTKVKSNYSSFLKYSLFVFATCFGCIVGEVASAAPDHNFSVAQSHQEQTIQGDIPMSQVTSVSELRDVEPTDWAYQSLQNLIERYGCIVGYPNQTYRGNQALSRYEFAAGLNACLNQIERLIASSEAVAQEDLETLQRLMQDFEAELATLGGRIDNIEGRVAFLEDHQFSTTTNLRGQMIWSIDDTFGDSVGGDRNNTQTRFAYRIRLNLESSFTGQDFKIYSEPVFRLAILAN